MNCPGRDGRNVFPDLEYLRWIEGKPDAATHDLGSSDLRPWADDRPITDRLSALAESERSLSALIADRYDVPETWVVPTAGATHANVLAAVAAIDRSEHQQPRILVEKPGYEPLRTTPELFGATVDRFLRPPASEYGLGPERVGAALAEQTALVTVTNRHNPSGRLADRDAIAAVTDRAAEAGAPLLVDEVYGPFTATRDDAGAFGGVTAAGLDDVVVTGSLTKFHGLGHLRIGWLIAPPEFADSVRKATRHLPAVAGPSHDLARRALAAPDRIEPKARDRLVENHDLLAAFVERRDDLHGAVFPGSTFTFLEHEAADGNQVVDAAWDEGVLVVPGRFFDDDDAFRLSLTGPADETERALSTFETVLDDLTRV